jgi:dTDP-4-dehydrorhamnose reductase
MKIAVIGANGQLGQDVSGLLERRGHEVDRLAHTDIEIRDWNATCQVLTSLRPDCVINTAAMLRVDDAEDQPEMAFAVNTLGVRNLARVAEAEKFSLVHFSTDYVFDGEKGTPYVETDQTGPLGAYAVSKLAGEAFVRALAPRHFVIRISGIYGTAPCRGKNGENFVLTMLRLARERDVVRVVDDEILTPTFTFDVAEQLGDLVETESYGLYHMTAAGACSWYQFTEEIFQKAGIATTVQPVSREKFPTRAKRPRYSVLDNAALRTIGIEHMPHWKDGLSRYIAQIRQN